VVGAPDPRLDAERVEGLAPLLVGHGRQVGGGHRAPRLQIPDVRPGPLPRLRLVQKALPVGAELLALRLERVEFFGDQGGRCAGHAAQVLDVVPLLASDLRQAALAGG
jgi:hypothetical protein